MKSAKILTLALAACLLLSFSAGAKAPTPMETLKHNVDEFIKILKDPKFKDPANKKQQDDLIWERFNHVFDFEGLSVRAVGRNWRKFSDKEKKEFSDSFAELLAANYLTKIRDGYRDEKVEFVDTDMISDNKALVHTKVLYNKKWVAVDYSMWFRDNQWRSYDVKVEGVSLVKNYRAQFNEILLKNSPAYLIDRVKKKVAAQKEQEAQTKNKS